MLRFLSLLFIASFASIPAQAVECRCAGPDPLIPNSDQYSSTCAKYEPAKLNRDCFASGKSTCAFPLPKLLDQGESAATETLVKLGLMKFPIRPAKSFDEVLDYVSCWRQPTSHIPTGDQQFCHFKKTLAPYIKLAAESAKFQPAVFACLFKRESEFDAHAMSTYGTDKKGHAYNYPQFTPETQDMIGPLLKYTAQDRLAEIARTEQKLRQAKQGSADQKWLQNHLRNMRMYLKISRLWDRYWEGSPHIPRSFTRQSLACPKIAFAFSAAKQMFDLVSMFPEEQIIETETSIRVSAIASSTRNQGDAAIAQAEYDTALYLSGAYNQGYGGFKKDCPPGRGIKACLKGKGSLPDETLHHINSINNCAKSGSYEPMYGTYKDPNKHCEDYKCSTYR